MSADERAVVEFKTELASSLIAADECAVVENKTELPRSLVKTETKLISPRLALAVFGCKIPL